MFPAVNSVYEHTDNRVYGYVRYENRVKGGEYKRMLFNSDKNKHCN